MRNYSAEKYYRSICLSRFHATPCARSSHARADMHAIAGEVDAKLEEISTFPCQRVITQPKIITDPLAFADSMPHHARTRPALARTCRRWRSGCGVGRDDLQVFSFALHRSVPMRNYSAKNFHRSFCLCRFHATPCARSSHASARADMLPAARLTLS